MAFRNLLLKRIYTVIIVIVRDIGMSKNQLYNYKAVLPAIKHLLYRLSNYTFKQLQLRSIMLTLST